MCGGRGTEEGDAGEVGAAVGDCSSERLNEE